MRCRYSGPRGKSGFGCQFERMVAAAIGSQSSPKTSQPHAARDPGPFNAHNPDGGRSGLVQHVLRSPARIPAIGISVQGSVRRAGKRKTLYVIIRKNWDRVRGICRRVASLLRAIYRYETHRLERIAASGGSTAQTNRRCAHPSSNGTFIGGRERNDHRLPRPQPPWVAGGVHGYGQQVCDRSTG